MAVSKVVLNPQAIALRKLRAEQRREQEARSRRQRKEAREFDKRLKGATKRAYEFEQQRAKDRLVEDILRSIEAGEPMGRFAATQPEIRNFAISEEKQVAQPGEFAYIKPSHLKRLREKGVRRISIEGGGIKPSTKALNTLRLLQDGRIPVEEADPNQLLGQLGRLGQPPPMTTEQAQEIMRTGRIPEPTEGRQMIREPIFTPGQREDLRGLYGQFEPTPIPPETDLTQYAQQFVGEPTEATPLQNIIALAQQQKVIPKAPAKLITVFKTDQNAIGPRTMRVPDVGGHPPQGYEFKEERKPGTRTYKDVEEELKTRTGGGGGIGGRRGAPLVEGEERLTPPGTGATEEEWARYYWELAKMRMPGAAPSQIAAEARRLAAQGGFTDILG